MEFIEDECGVRVAAPDEARFMVYTPPQLQRTDLKDLVIVQPEVCVCERRKEGLVRGGGYSALCHVPSQTHTTEPPLQHPPHATNKQGPSFTVRGNHISWQNWNLRLGFTSQEGLVLQMVGFNDRLKAPDGACGVVWVGVAQDDGHNQNVGLHPLTTHTHFTIHNNRRPPPPRAVPSELRRDGGALRRPRLPPLQEGKP